MASYVFAAHLNGNIVAMISMLPQPSGAFDNGWKVHRLVVLPDYQGLGIGTKLLSEVCDLFTKHKRVVYLRTSHHKLITCMLKSKEWSGNGKLIKSVPEAGELKGRVINLDRKSASFKFVNLCKNDDKDYSLLEKYDVENKLKLKTLF